MQVNSFRLTFFHSLNIKWAEMLQWFWLSQNIQLEKYFFQHVCQICNKHLRDESEIYFRGGTIAVKPIEERSSLPLKTEHKETCTGQPLKALHNSLCNEAWAVSSLPSRYRTHARLNKTSSLVSSQMNFALRGQHLAKAYAVWAAVSLSTELWMSARRFRRSPDVRIIWCILYL